MMADPLGAALRLEDVEARAVLASLEWDDFDAQPKAKTVFGAALDSDEEDEDEGDSAAAAPQLTTIEEAAVLAEDTEAAVGEAQDDAAVDAALAEVFAEIARFKEETPDQEDPSPKQQIIRGSSGLGATIELTYDQLQMWNEAVRAAKEEEVEEKEEEETAEVAGSKDGT